MIFLTKSQNVRWKYKDISLEFFIISIHQSLAIYSNTLFFCCTLHYPSNQNIYSLFYFWKKIFTKKMRNRNIRHFHPTFCSILTNSILKIHFKRSCPFESLNFYNKMHFLYTYTFKSTKNKNMHLHTGVLFDFHFCIVFFLFVYQYLLKSNVHI